MRQSGAIACSALPDAAWTSPDAAAASAVKRSSGERAPRRSGGRARRALREGPGRGIHDDVIVVLSGRALALAVLAWSFLKVTVRRLFERGPSGLARFRENYDDDGLPPLSPSERAALPSFSRCIACGRCDLGEADRIAASRGAYPGLMAVVLASSRSTPDFDAAALALSHVPDEVLAQKEAICPTGVPFRALARFVRDKATLPSALPAGEPDVDGSARDVAPHGAGEASPDDELLPQAAGRTTPEAT